MPTVATRATFVIFKDEPSEPSPVKIKASVDQQTPSISTTTALAVTTAKDKENLLPTTARRSSGDEAALKRKGGAVLTTKVLKAPSKSLSEPHPIPRKRKLSVTDKNRPLGENVEVKKKKPASTSTASRKHKPKPANRIRKVTELPKVEEEVATEEGNAESGLQAQPKNAEAAAAATDYELTAPPSADVSTAPEPSLSLEEKPAKASKNAEVSQPEDDVQASETKAEDTTAVSEPPVTKTPTKLTIGIFSTPERKRLYSVFTFATPSPTSKRYKNSRASSVDRFSDYDFDPLSDAITFRTL